MLRINDSIKFQDQEFIISSFLGQGGMGHVFSILKKNGTSRFALKSLQYYIKDDNNHRSLINEWDKAQTIQHDNVIRYHGFHDGLSEPNTPFLIMEYAEDGSLENFIKDQKELLDESTCLEIFHQIVNGMEAVNKVLIHRDIKPDNIFLSNGIFKIADFGLAKIAQEKTRSKTFKGWGTEPYIAPEAYRAENNTIQMDMYSIGHVFYQIAALKHAFGQQLDWEKAHLTMAPKLVSTENTKISPKVASIINKLMAKRPSMRYSSWEDVRSDLLRSTQNTGSYKSAIDKILQSKIAREQQAEKEESEKQRVQNEKNRKENILNFQFESEIIKPLSDFVDDFNKVSGSTGNMRIQQAYRTGDLRYDIAFSNNTVNIWFHKISEYDVLKRSGNDMWGQNREFIIKPKLNQKSVLAWGGLESSDRKGLNIVLVESDLDEYGDFYILENTHSGLARQSDNRPDPFAFTSSELLKEIHVIGAMHIYNTKVNKLNINALISFVSTSF
jgi:serine/threonine protein kinase